ncbi:3-oxo-5-alpha-steroid 4-dehydrogenase [Nesidiocoris tenuis]|uniref:Polyprenal reductase n=1 Tax=Nesidiocoris tenuis TaxID=355587 RepID=A0ABN7BFR1_9HEMI|nr:3-oxo-5-alpha-steroid 4-dehydrogenase [Nesidiocoris tenuis]
MISLKLIFSIITFLTVFLGLLVNFAENHLPAFVSQLYRYGKFEYRGASKNWTIRVPKSWFRHFYLFGSIYSTLTFAIVLCLYLKYISSPPSFLMAILDALDQDRAPNASSAAVFVASFLLMIQCWRRFYETYFVSIFSPGKMDVGHYFLGLIHYFGAVTAIVIEAPGFDKTESSGFHFRLKDLNFIQYAAMTAFLWAWIVQYDCACILANLRKNPKGEIVTVKHKVPQGRMFNLVSCPHLLCEISMYICLNIIVWGNTTFPFILMWVLANQVETAMLSHWWYKAQFPNYPKSRKALIPFLL